MKRIAQIVLVTMMLLTVPRQASLVPMFEMSAHENGCVSGLTVCVATGGGMSMDCLVHCLSAAPGATSTATPNVSSLAVAMIALIALIAIGTAATPHVGPDFTDWIGKRLRRHTLAGIVLLN